MLAWPPSAAVADTTVTINSSASCSGSTFCYSPASASTQVGVAVNWTNPSGANHTVTRCTSVACSGTDGGNGTDSFPDSGTIDAGATYSHTFTATGTYNYYCTIHGYATMHGTITVSDSQSSTTSPSGSSTTVASSSQSGVTTIASSSSATSTTKASGTITTSASGLPHTGRGDFNMGIVAALFVGLGIWLIAAAQQRRRRGFTR